MNKKVISSESCPTRLHAPSEPSGLLWDESGPRCRHRTGLKVNQAPNARQKGVSFSRLRTRSAIWPLRSLIAFRGWSTLTCYHDGRVRRHADGELRRRQVNESA
jgi:hypothetical protein